MIDSHPAAVLSVQSPAVWLIRLADVQQTTSPIDLQHFIRPLKRQCTLLVAIESGNICCAGCPQKVQEEIEEKQKVTASPAAAGDMNAAIH